MQRYTDASASTPGDPPETSVAMMELASRNNERQKLLPQVQLKWAFAAVTGAAVLIALVRITNQGAALVGAIVAVSGWLVLLFGMFGILFLFTYALGVLERLLAPPQDEVLSPFASERLPEQIVVPLKTDAQ